MSRVCQVTGKRPLVGYNVSHSNRHTKRRFEINLRTKRFWMEDEKRFDEYMKVSVGQAGPVYRARVDNPYWKSDPNFDAMLQNILKSVPLGHPGPITSAAAEVRGQKILTDMAGRVVVGGLSPEAALKEAQARVEEIYKIRSKG